MNDDRSRNPRGGSEPVTETPDERSYREFVEGITFGRVTVVRASRAPVGETPYEREQREWVESITLPDNNWGPPSVLNTGHSRTPPEPVPETAAHRASREWVESITTREVWDPALHPRGGYPRNTGMFSPAGGSSGAGASSGSDGRAPLRSWSKPSHLAQSPPAGRVYGTGGYGHSATAPNHAPQSGQLAFQPPPPQPGQPRVVRPAQPGQQPLQPAAPAIAYKRFPNKFGEFADRLPGPPKQSWFTLNRSPKLNATRFEKRAEDKVNQDLTALSDRLNAHVKERIPEKVKEALRDDKVHVAILPALSDKGLKSQENDSTHGLYRPAQGTIYIPMQPEAGVGSSGPERSIRHEFGHAFDHKIDGSMSPEFLKAYWDDLEAAGKLRDKRLDHFVPGKVGEPKTAEERRQRTTPKEQTDAAAEAFAEAFAEATQATKEGQATEFGGAATPFREKFPRTIAHVREAIKRFAEQQRSQPANR